MLDDKQLSNSKYIQSGLNTSVDKHRRWFMSSFHQMTRRQWEQQSDGSLEEMRNSLLWFFLHCKLHNTNNISHTTPLLDLVSLSSGNQINKKMTLAFLWRIMFVYIFGWKRAEWERFSQGIYFGRLWRQENTRFIQQAEKLFISSASWGCDSGVRSERNAAHWTDVVGSHPSQELTSYGVTVLYCSPNTSQSGQQNLEFSCDQKKNILRDPLQSARCCIDLHGCDFTETTTISYSENGNPVFCPGKNLFDNMHYKFYTFYAMQKVGCICSIWEELLSNLSCGIVNFYSGHVCTQKHVSMIHLSVI